MKVCIVGTDTSVGKTLISSWLCLHTRFPYWKPIQTGSIEDNDTETVQKLSQTKTYPEAYIYQAPLSPHLAAALEHDEINVRCIHIPDTENLVIEGAGGIFVPLNRDQLLIDLIQVWDMPVIIVARSSLGTINHTCLTVEALRQRNIPLLGVVMSGEYNRDNRESIETYADIPVLAEFPKLQQVSTETLRAIPLPKTLCKALAFQLSVSIP